MNFSELSLLISQPYTIRLESVNVAPGFGKFESPWFNT